MLFLPDSSNVYCSRFIQLISNFLDPRRIKSKSALDEVIKKFTKKEEEAGDAYQESRYISDKESDLGSNPPSVSPHLVFLVYRGLFNVLRRRTRVLNSCPDKKIFRQKNYRFSYLIDYYYQFIVCIFLLFPDNNASKL